MKYIKETIFEKYDIMPQIDKDNLRDFLKNDVNTKKDHLFFEELNDIENDEMLFQHELFTIRKDQVTDEILLTHQNILRMFKEIIKKRDGKKFTNLNSELNKFLSYTNLEKVFYYADNVKKEVLKQTNRNFVLAILIEMIDNLLFDYENISENYFEHVLSLINYFDLFLNKRNALSGLLERGLTNMIQSCINWLDEIEMSRIYLNYICAIPKRVIEKEKQYQAFVAFVDALINRREQFVVQQVLIENYIPLFNFLSREDAIKRSNLIEYLIDQNLDLKAEKKDINFRLLEYGLKLIEDFKHFKVRLYDKNSEIDINGLKIKICFVKFFLNHSEEWYQKYFVLTRLIKNKSNAENICQWVLHLYSDRVPEILERHIGKILMEVTNFYRIIDSLEKRKIRTVEIIKTASKKITTGYALYHHMVNLLEKTFITSAEVDEVVGCYYSLIYLVDNEYYHQCLNDLVQATFLITNVLDELPDIEPKLAREFIMKVLKESPEDWSYKKQKVSYILKRQFNNEVSNYGPSLASKYIEIYQNIFSHKRNNNYWNDRHESTDEMNDYRIGNRRLNYIIMKLYHTYDCGEAWVLKHYYNQQINKNWRVSFLMRSSLWFKVLVYKVIGHNKKFKNSQRKKMDAYVERLKAMGVSTKPYVEIPPNK